MDRDKTVTPVKTFTKIHLTPSTKEFLCIVCGDKIENAQYRLRLLNKDRRMAENGFAPPSREFCRHILSCRELEAESFKRCLHSVLRGVSL